MKFITCLTVFSFLCFLTNCDRNAPPASVKKDVKFAKETFESLARGDSSVAERIDWAVFTSLGEDFGVSYNALTSGVEKERFVTNFITQFATNFRQSGGSVDNYSNWRVVSHDSIKTEVAADSAKGVLSIIVSERDDVERVSSMNLIP